MQDMSTDSHPTITPHQASVAADVMIEQARGEARSARAPRAWGWGLALKGGEFAELTDHERDALASQAGRALWRQPLYVLAVATMLAAAGVLLAGTLLRGWHAAGLILVLGSLLLCMQRYALHRTARRMSKN